MENRNRPNNKSIKLSDTFYVRILILSIIFLGFILTQSRPKAITTNLSWWSVQSIDTVKYSRDVAREKLDKPSYDQTIDTQVRNIAATGATHIALGTPYDEEFIPFLKRWVNAARRYGLHVWFRGNFSGWEGWFGYPKITRKEHELKTKEFIYQHRDLFEDGDIFTPCPECENGGSGDPRHTGDVAGFRKFIISEYQITTSAFQSIGKNVISNFNSYNGDVARLIMDKDTTASMGGVVVIDHYVKNPDRLVTDIKDIAQKSGGKVVLGEFGAPIPDIHGSMDESQQKAYLLEVFTKLAPVSDLIGVNYWTNEGGSTKLWEGGKAKEAVGTLRAFYSPRVISGTVINELGEPIAKAIIGSQYRTVVSDNDGTYQIPVLSVEKTLTVSAPSYISKEVNIEASQTPYHISLSKENESLLFRLRKWLKKTFRSAQTQ